MVSFESNAKNAVYSSGPQMNKERSAGIPCVQADFNFLMTSLAINPMTI